MGWGLTVLRAGHLDGFPESRQKMPKKIRPHFDCCDEETHWSVFVTSHNTHAHCTVVAMEEILPARPFHPPQYDDKGQELVAEPERRIPFYKSKFQYTHVMIIADEGQRLRNVRTLTWHSIYKMKAMYFWAITSTPMLNSHRDITGPMCLM